MLKQSNCVNLCFFFLSFFYLSLSLLSYFLYLFFGAIFLINRQYCCFREDINNLHTNVEFLTNRINSASTIIANNNAINEAYTNETEPISSSIHSSPQNYDVNLSASSIQPEKSQYTVVDDINANSNNLVTNYSISNNSSYEPPTSLSASQIDSNVTPTRSIIRSNSIRNINDDDIQPNYYNETIQPSSISYVEPQPASGNIQDFSDCAMSFHNSRFI